MREIKFRAWDNRKKQILNYGSLVDCAFFYMCNSCDYEVMQYTGLKDKQGVEIYEGDIVEFITFGFDVERFVTVIEFKNASFRLKNGRNLFYFGQTDFTKLDDCRVIGNIYENPELLKDKQ